MAPLPGSDPQRLAEIGEQVSARLDANPRVTRIKSPRIDMFAVPAFIAPAECTELVALIDSDVKPSTSLRVQTGEKTRTSSTCKLPSEHQLVAAIDQRIADLLGLDPGHAETLQGQRYEPGQQFRTHNDYFASGQSFSEAIANEGGQRTWTAMAYLNRTEKGGATNFPMVPVAIPPTPGVLLVWNNMDKNGQSNPYSHHAGTVVEAGRKYVLTKWFRERAWNGSEVSDSYRV
ncbi:MAG: 2OG-Fe(II) oxygenase [Sphingomonadales bacterium]|nr:MAG: 2OG-Fe(II) oxygenase [Sphingomonadales bacterium]